MKTGSVIWYNAKKGIGFIKPDEHGPDVFIHMRALKASGLKQVKEGEHLGYILAADPETGREAAAEIQRIPAADAAVRKPTHQHRNPRSINHTNLMLMPLPLVNWG